jgi:hypothetical protein
MPMDKDACSTTAAGNIWWWVRWFNSRGKLFGLIMALLVIPSKIFDVR